MTIDLAPDTRQLLAERMASGGYRTEDDLIRQLLLETAPDGDDELALAPETLTAIAAGVAQVDRGEVAPWDPADVRRELARRGRPVPDAADTRPAVGA